MTTDLTIPLLQEIVDACAGKAPAEILLGTNRASIGDVALQCIATMQENAELRAHPLKLICEKCNVLTDVSDIRSEYLVNAEQPPARAEREV